MHNLSTVIGFEFLRTVKKKTFWLGTLAFPVMVTIIFALSYVSGKSASDAEKQVANERFSAVVMDRSGLVRPEALQALDIKTTTDKEAAINEVKNNAVEAFIYYPEDPSSATVEVYAKDVGLTKNSKYTAVAEELLKSSVSAEIRSPEQVAIIRGQIKSDLTTYTNGVEAPGFERAIIPGLFLIIFYLVIVLLGPQMLTSTTEEKENRVIEMILTSVQAKTLIIGKILSLLLVGLVQIAVTLLPVIIGLVFFGDRLNMPDINLSQLPVDPMQLGIAIVVFLGAFLLFTGILVAIGASVPTAKEANSFFGVAIGGMFVPLYMLMAIISSPDQLLVKIFSFFPLTAPVTLLLRNAAGNLSLGEAAIGVAIIIVTGIIALGVAIRAFQFGTLEYSRKLSLKELFVRS